MREHYVYQIVFTVLEQQKNGVSIASNYNI